MLVSALPNQRIPLKTNKEVVEKKSIKLNKLVGVWYRKADNLAGGGLILSTFNSGAIILNELR